MVDICLENLDSLSLIKNTSSLKYYFHLCLAYWHSQCVGAFVCSWVVTFAVGLLLLQLCCDICSCVVLSAVVLWRLQLCCDICSCVVMFAVVL